MKDQNVSVTDKILLRKRALVESVNDELINICNIEHTRHRVMKDFLANLVSAMISYQVLPKKLSLNIQPFENNSNQLLLCCLTIIHVNKEINIASTTNDCTSYVCLLIYEIH